MSFQVNTQGVDQEVYCGVSLGKEDGNRLTSLTRGKKETEKRWEQDGYK